MASGRTCLWLRELEEAPVDLQKLRWSEAHGAPFRHFGSSVSKVYFSLTSLAVLNAVTSLTMKGIAVISRSSEFKEVIWIVSAEGKSGALWLPWDVSQL